MYSSGFAPWQFMEEQLTQKGSEYKGCVLTKLQGAEQAADTYIRFSEVFWQFPCILLL